MRLFSVLCLFGAGALFAQTPPVEASTSTNPSGGGATITVHNRAASPLIAFAFVYTLRGQDLTVYSASYGYYDALADPAQHPVAPGEDVKLPYYAGNRGMSPMANIEAAVFADGATFGHQDMVKTIFERRNYTLVTINKSIAELKQAAKENATREQLISHLQQEMSDERLAAGNNDLAQCILTVRNQVFMDLVNARNPDRTPMPIEKAIAAEIENLVRRRDALLAAATSPTQK